MTENVDNTEPETHYVMLVKPGDVLLIANVGDVTTLIEDEEAVPAIQKFFLDAGITVALFANDITIGKASREEFIPMIHNLDAELVSDEEAEEEE